MITISVSVAGVRRSISLATARRIARTLGETNDPTEELQIVQDLFERAVKLKGYGLSQKGPFLR
jgi:hypothetical protein